MTKSEILSTSELVNHRLQEYEERDGENTVAYQEVEATNHYVVGEPVNVSRESEGGILMATSYRGSGQYFRVVSKGPGRWTPSGMQEPLPNVNVGDIVRLGPGKGLTESLDFKGRVAFSADVVVCKVIPRGEG